MNLTEELDKAVVTIGLVILLFEGALVELFQAEGTDKMLWVELLSHSSDTAACDRLLTSRAQ